MDALDLIGRVAAERLRQLLSAEDATEDTSRFLLHKLKATEVVAVTRAILADRELCSRITVLIPRAVLGTGDVPDHVLTSMTAAEIRNTPVGTDAMVFATADDDLADTVGLVTQLGATELKADPELWVAAANAQLRLPEEIIHSWAVALAGLRGAYDASLQQFAEYVALTEARISEGQPLASALGWALPALHAPRDSAAFVGLRDADRLSVTRWRKRYLQVVSPRHAMLQKQGAGRAPLTAEALQQQYERFADQVPAEAVPYFREFFDSPPGWNAAAAALATREWEADCVGQLFENLRAEKASLGGDTRRFFEVEHPDALTAEEREYLTALEQRRSTGTPRDEDREFYDKYRSTLRG